MCDLSSHPRGPSYPSHLSYSIVLHIGLNAFLVIWVFIQLCFLTNHPHPLTHCPLPSIRKCIEVKVETLKHIVPPVHSPTIQLIVRPPIKLICYLLISKLWRSTISSPLSYSIKEVSITGFNNCSPNSICCCLVNRRYCCCHTWLT